MSQNLIVLFEDLGFRMHSKVKIVSVFFLFSLALQVFLPQFAKADELDDLLDELIKARVAVVKSDSKIGVRLAEKDKEVERVLQTVKIVSISKSLNSKSN